MFGSYERNIFCPPPCLLKVLGRLFSAARAANNYRIHAKFQPSREMNFIKPPQDDGNFEMQNQCSFINFKINGEAFGICLRKFGVLLFLLCFVIFPWSPFNKVRGFFETCFMARY